MKRTIILPALITAFVALSPAGVALADNPHNAGDNPNRTGQPSQEANLANSPPGFSTGVTKGQTGKGFANAELHYADPGSLPSNNPKAKSQYDVAGFQWSQHHPAP
jgi:hypothetical protein